MPIHDIRAVVWDVDDTIFDYTNADRAGMRGHLAAEGLARRIRVRRAGPRPLARRSPTEQWARFAAGETDWEGQRRDRVRAFLGRARLTDAEADAWFERYLVPLRGRLGAVPGHRCPSWTPSPDQPPARGPVQLQRSTTRTASCASSASGTASRPSLCAAELGVSKPAGRGLPRRLRGPGTAPARGRVRRRPARDRRTGAATPGCSRSGSTGRLARTARGPVAVRNSPHRRSLGRTPRAPRRPDTRFGAPSTFG